MPLLLELAMCQMRLPLPDLDPDTDSLQQNPPDPIPERIYVDSAGVGNSRVII